MRARVGLALTLALSLAVGAALAETYPDEVLEHQAYAREYYLHVPEAVASGALGRVPLVVMLHGRGGTGPGMAALTAFDAVADEHGFIVVYPSGVDNQWNYVEGIPGYAIEVPDVAFLRALVGHLEERLPVDVERVYVGGFSNGGYMAQRLACDAGDLFAAFASVGAAGFGGQLGICGEGEPVSLLLMHGTHDRVVPFNGLQQEGPNGPVTVLASVEQTFAFWAARSGCELEVDGRQLVSVRSPEMEVHVLSASACPEGYELQLVVFVGGGHNWPGRPGLLPAEVAGAINLDVDASRYLWAFFARHRLSESRP